VRETAPDMIVTLRLHKSRTLLVLASGYAAAQAISRKIVRGPKFLVAVLIFFAATNTLNVAEPSIASVPLLVYQSDPRADRLAAFFKIYHCPAPHHVQDYIRVADAYGLDYRLLPAISIRETTCGLAEKDNNRWGYHPGRQAFPSVGEGINFLARQLAQNPPYVGKSTRQKLLTYNPRPSYPAEIEHIMRQIE
jgi:hypothetical protein